MSAELDRGWSEHRLTDVVTLPTGQVDPRELPYREQPLLAPDHVESGTGRIIDLRTAESQGASSGKYIVRPGDVVLSKIRPALRKVALSNFGGICSADMYPLRLGPGLLPEFLQAELLGERFSLFAESVSSRTGIPKLNRADLASYVIHVPPVSEQHRIVDILDTVSESERVADAEVMKLQAIRKILIEQLAQHTHMLMKDVIIDGPRNGIYKPEGQYAYTGTPIVRINSFEGGPSDLTRGLLRVKVSGSELQRYGISVGDVLINRVNTPGLVGKSTAVSGLNEPTLFESNIMRCRIDVSKVNPKIVEAWLSGSVARSHFAARTKPAVSQASINRSDVFSCPVPKMDSGEQVEFLNKLAAVDSVISESRARVAKVRMLRKGLAADLLSGKTSVEGWA